MNGQLSAAGAGSRGRAASAISAADPVTSTVVSGDVAAALHHGIPHGVECRGEQDHSKTAIGMP